MPSTGDIQNDLRKLQTELRYIKYHDVDFKSYAYFLRSIRFSIDLSSSFL